MSRSCDAESSGTVSLPPGVQDSCMSRWWHRTEFGSSPVSCNLDLECMRAEELDIGIGMAEERDDKTPRFWSALSLEQLLL